MQSLSGTPLSRSKYLAKLRGMLSESEWQEMAEALVFALAELFGPDELIRKFRVSKKEQIRQCFIELEQACGGDNSKFGKWILDRTNRAVGIMETVSFEFQRGSFEPVHGRCPYQCEYCYNHLDYRTEHDRSHYDLDPKDYNGELRLNSEAFMEDLEENKFIIVGMGNDLWASPTSWIDKTLDFLNDFPKNSYNFLTKNPARYEKFLNKLPEKSMLTCTIETDEYKGPVSKAPSPAMRAEAFKRLDWPCKQLILMPILPFDSQRFFDMICEINPDYLDLNAVDARAGDVPGVPSPSPEQLIKVFELTQMIIKFTDIQLVGPPDATK